MTHEDVVTTLGRHSEILTTLHKNIKVMQNERAEKLKHFVAAVVRVGGGP